MDKRDRESDLLFDLKLTQPFDKAFVLDLLVPALKFHHEFFLLQTTERNQGVARGNGESVNQQLAWSAI